MKPVSLNQDTLRDQVQEIREVKADIEDHQPGVESVNKSVSKVIKSADPKTQGVMEV